MMKPILSHLLLCLLIMFCSAANARIINTQDTQFSIQENGLYLNSDFALNQTTGTADVLQFSGALGSQWLREPHLAFFAASGTFAKKDDERFINKYLGHLRYRYRIWKMVMAEVFAQAEYNEFRRILARVPCGIGPRIQYSVGEEQLFQVALGSSYMFEMVHLSKDKDENGVVYPDSLHTEYNHRWNNYLAFKLNLDFMSMGATLYAQPLFKDFSDWMLLLESDVSFTVTEQLSISLAYTLFHDRNPPEAVMNRDSSLKAILKVTLGPWFGDSDVKTPAQ